mgnify:CR=1 FL=1
MQKSPFPTKYIQSNWLKKLFFFRNLQYYRILTMNKGTRIRPQTQDKDPDPFRLFIHGSGSDIGTESKMGWKTWKVRIFKEKFPVKFKKYGEVNKISDSKIDRDPDQAMAATILIRIRSGTSGYPDPQPYQAGGSFNNMFRPVSMNGSWLKKAIFMSEKNRVLMNQ